MLLQRFYHEGLAQASYLLGCQKTGEAIVIDPNRDPVPYMEFAQRNAMKITMVTETHIHADYLSGSRELASRTGAQLLLSAEGGRDWQYAFADADRARLLRDGDQIKVGNLRLDVVHTPGHTPEHLTFVVTDLPASDRPVGAFTGDFIFVGDVGRPDLLEKAANIAGTMRAGASTLFDSLQRFVSTWPEYLQIWPGHGSGSACGKALGAVPMSTLGYERVANWALRITDREAFITEVLAGQPDPPRYFATMKRLNRDGPRVLGGMPSAAQAPVSHLAGAIARGLRIIDLRPAATFAAGFVPGTINIPLNKSFVTWAGWLMRYDEDFYLLHDQDDDAAIRAALGELMMIGLDRCAGWLGPNALRAQPLASIPQIDATGLSQPATRGLVDVLDVRAADEYASGHIEGARHIPLGRLEEQIANLTPGRPLVVQCQAGGRSAIAASLLAAHGLAGVTNLTGGIAAWQSAGLPVITGVASSNHG